MQRYPDVVDNINIDCSSSPKNLFRQMDSVRHMKTSSNVMIPHLAKKDKRSE